MALGATPASAAARAACTFPKGWYTAQAEYQYATYLFTGQAGDSVSQAGDALRNPQNTPAIRGALTNVTSGNAERAATFVTAMQTYATKVVEASLQNPPTCPRRRP